MVAGEPTGQQHELRFEDHAATVVEVGGGLRQYTVGGRPVLDGFDAQSRVDGGRGQVLVPWPNRVRDGRYTWAGAELQLPLTEAKKQNSIHGLLRWTSWALLKRQRHRVLLGCRVWAQPGYPFQLEVAVDYSLAADGLSVAVTSRNIGTDGAPYGVGQHPYITAGTPLVDGTLLTIPAERWIATDDRGIPTGSRSVEGTEYDFRRPRAVGGQCLDTAFAGLARDRSGSCAVRLGHPTHGSGVDVWLGEGVDYVQVFTGDTLPDPTRRRQGIAVEPMSCQPDAFRSGDGLVTLAPGATHTLRWGLTPF